MINHSHTQRIVSAALVVVGGLLIFLAPEHVLAGSVMAVLGVAIESIAIMVGHGKKAVDADWAVRKVRPFTPQKNALFAIASHDHFRSY
jgi:hypothetical protein